MKLNKHYSVRGLQETDLDGPYPSWFEDEEVCAYNSHGKFHKTREHLREFIRRINGSEMVVWAICHETDGHIGNVALQSISVINRNAEFAILMGNRRHWGKGVGLLASRAMLAHGFRKLNLHRIYCGTAATNSAMKKLALSLGMKKEGVRKEHLFLNGQWVDVVEFGILRVNFKLNGPK
jgi:ribosomal-protein-alanine N-acetyltransferase